MEKNNNETKKFSLVILGDDGVGKSNIINYYINEEMNTFNNSIIGIQELEKIIKIGNEQVEVKLIDTAGQEKYKGVTKSIYKQGDGFIIFFNYSNKESFNSIVDWYENIIENSNYALIPPPVLIVGILHDNEKKKEEMNLDLIKTEIKKKKPNIDLKNIIKFFDCNDTELDEINKIFEIIIKHLLENKQDKKYGRDRANSISLQKIDGMKETKKKCCKNN